MKRFLAVSLVVISLVLLVFPTPSFAATLSDSESISYGDGYCQESFSTPIQWSYLVWHVPNAFNVSGSASSVAYWTGSTPQYYATWIKLSTNLWLAGAAGIYWYTPSDWLDNNSAGTTTWSSTSYNVWSASHYYGTEVWATFGNAWQMSITQNDFADFYFASTGYTVTVSTTDYSYS